MKNENRIEERRTLGLAYITKETIQEEDSLPFINKRIGQDYYKLSYCPGYPSLNEPKDLLVMRSADRTDSLDKDNAQIKLEDFGEDNNGLFLSLDKEKMYDPIMPDPWFRDGFERKRLEILSREEEEDFWSRIPGSGGDTEPKRFISTAKGALTFQEDFYDELRNIYIDQARMPFAGLRRVKVGWIEGNQFIDGFPKFDFVAYEFDGEKWGECIGNLEKGFHFRKEGKIKTLNTNAIVSYLGKDSNLTPEDLQLVRLPGHENKGVVFGQGKAYEIEMDPTDKEVKVSSSRELPFQNVVKISPISLQKTNDTFLKWAEDPRTNPHVYRNHWICRT